MNNLKIIERENQRVLTTEQLAEVYGTDTKNISNNFSRNQDKFIEGKHYYLLKGDELKEFKANHLKDDYLKFAPHLYLWTERGASRHCKILDTEKAWEQFDYLEDTYFKVKQDLDVKQLSPELQMFKQIFDSVAATQLQQKELEYKLKTTNNRIDTIKEVVSLDSTSWRGDTQNILNKIAIKLGGTSELFKQLRKESYELLDRRMGVALDIRLNNLKKNKALSGANKTQINSLNKMDVVALDKKLIEGYIAIVKEMAIKYGIAD